MMDRFWWTWVSGGLYLGGALSVFTGILLAWEVIGNGVGSTISLGLVVGGSVASFIAAAVYPHDVET